MVCSKQYKVNEDKFRGLWVAGKSYDEIAHDLNISASYIPTLRRRYDLPRRDSAIRRPPPHDLAEVAAKLTLSEMRDHYHAHVNTIQRWLKDLGIKSKAPSLKREVPSLPRDFKERAAYMPVRGDRGLMSHYRVGRTIMEAWLREAGITPRARNGREHRVKAKAKVAAFDANSEVAQAAHFLRKFYRNVHSTDIPVWEICDRGVANTWWRAKHLGVEASGKYYVSGVGIVREDWVIEKAYKKGWTGLK